MACNNMCWSPATQSAVQVTWKNKSINPNQSPIIHPRPQFSQQRSHQGLSTRFELIPLSFLIRSGFFSAELSLSGKGKELGVRREGYSLSSFIEKVENCFPSELLGLREALGSIGYQFPGSAGSAGHSSRKTALPKLPAAISKNMSAD